MEKRMNRRMMIMNKRCMVFILTLVLVGSLATGCGSSSENLKMVNQSDYSQSDDYGMTSNYAVEEYEETGAVQTDSYDVAEAAVEEKADSTSGSGVSSATSNVSNNSTQKIIKRYDYDYETEKFDEAYAYLKERINIYGGYVASSDLTGNGSSSSYRTLYLIARIPAEKSDAFIGEMGSLGTVVKQSESAEDVTLQYSDTESRIESLKAEQDSLNKLLEQADSLETIITLQDRLTEVRYELESYQSRKKLYDDLISYSTIDISLKEVNYTVEVDESTFFSRIMTGLERSLRDVADDFVSFVEWLIINIPYFVVWGVIIFIIVKVVRKFNMKRKEKKMKKQLAKQETLAQGMTASNMSAQNLNANVQKQEQARMDERVTDNNVEMHKK